MFPEPGLSVCVFHEATGSSDSYLPRVRDSVLGDI